MQLSSRFSQNQFLNKKIKFSPFFFKTAGPIGLKFFLGELGSNWGASFFFLKTTDPKKFGSL
jgi:hypothetical protein